MSSTSDAVSNVVPVFSSTINTQDLDADAQSDYSSSSLSESVSDACLSRWAPGGVYVPIHRRGRSNSTTTSTSASTAPTSESSSPSKTSFAPKPKPRPGAYTRAELLVLAPSSLIYASLHPLVTPALLAKHPRILRARGDGVVRALDMARQDSNSILHLNQPPVQASPNFARTQSSGEAAKMGGRVDLYMKKQSTPAQVPGPAPGNALAPLSPEAQARPGTPTQPRATRRRDRGRRRANVAYQRNFAQQANPSPAPSARADFVRANDANAKLGPSPFISPSPTPEKNAMKIFVPTLREGSNRRRRQRLDVAVLSNWRAAQPVVA